MSAHSRRHYVQGETVIDAAPVAVWEVLSDFHGVDTWAPIITRVVDIGPTARGVGTARHCHVRRLGGIDEVVAAQAAGRDGPDGGLAPPRAGSEHPTAAPALAETEANAT